MSVDDVVTALEPVAYRDDVGVEQHVAVWKKTPAGSTPLARVLIERGQPICYSFLPDALLRSEARVFSAYRAAFVGSDVGEGGPRQRWAVLPYRPGITLPALLDALGSGRAPLEVALHMAHWLGEAVSAYELVTRPVALREDGTHFNTHEPATRTRPASIVLVRPFDTRSFRIEFNGAVSFEVVTDTVRLSAEEFSAAQEQLEASASACWTRARMATRFVLHRLVGPSVDPNDFNNVALAHDPRLPAGRALLIDMLRALFPVEHARGRDLEESALVPEHAP